MHSTRAFPLRSRLRVTGAGVITASALTAVGAPGEWPVGHHDAARTGAADLPSPFTEPPVPTWRQYVGGSMSQYVLADVDGDAKDDLFYLAGGVVLHKSADNQEIWRRKVPAAALYGPMDLDGDGSMEILAVQSTPVRLTVLSVFDGSILWTFDDSSEIGTVGAIRIRDLDLDGVQDLLVEECHCCTYNSGKPGFAMRFTSGFGAPTRLYSIGSDCGSSGDLFADLDGTGQQYWEIGYNTVKGTDTVTGTVKYSLTTEVTRSATRVEAADLDGDGSDELVFLNTYYQSGIGVPRFGVWDLDKGTGQLEVLWERPLSDPEEDRLEAGVRWVGDLDDDGSLELVISIYSDAVNAWTMYVVDALTGVDLAQLADHRAVGLADLEAGGGLEILSANPDKDHLYAWSWTQSGLSPLWNLADRRVFSARADADGGTTQYSDLVVADFDQDGQLELPLRVLDENLSTVNMALIDPAGSSSSPAELARTAVPDGLALERAVRCDGFGDVSPALCQVRTDGYLQVLDSSLTVTNQDGPEPAFLPGLELGGYLPADSLGAYPLVSRLEADGPPLVWTRNSQGYHVALDPEGASLYAPPAEALAIDSLSSLALADLDGDGDRELLYVDPDRRLHARRADGVTDAWTSALAPEDASVPFGLAAADANGDGILDVFYSWYTADGYSTVTPVSGTNGIALWSQPFAVLASWGAYPFAVGDLDADGDADLATTWNSFYVVDGKTGSTLISDNVFRAYGVPILWQTDGDAALEVVQQAGYYPDRLLDLDFTAKTSTVKWDDGQYLRTGQQGAVLTCSASDVRFVKGYNADDRFQVYTLSTGAMLADWVAAGGQLYADDDAAEAAGAEGGQLTHMVSSPDLTGLGTPAVLFGSSDGYLYAFDACGSASALLWTVDFGANVGAPVLADTDDDGESEILVHVGDGYLYNLDLQLMSPPGYVWDLEAPGGAVDIDALSTQDSLFASWSPVEGATSYDVGVLSASNAYITEPAFQTVTALETAVSGLELCDGATYRLAVRARGDAGISTETLSDGVTVRVGEVCDGKDNNCDGVIDEGYDADGDGAVSCETDVPADCDDADPSSWPGAPEYCDGKDNDCDGTIDDDAVDAPTWYGDTDKDGYGNPDYTKKACSQPKNFVANDLDCDDTEKTVYPGAPEVCDTLDNDCDGTVDEELETTFYVDADGDGYGSSAGTVLACSVPDGYSSVSTDCDDGDGAVHPGAAETCDEIDQDCDGEIDEGVAETFYPDGDGDGYGDDAVPVQACEAPVGTVTDGTDCDDTAAGVHPGAEEVCGDGVDQDCNGYDLGCGDVDQDGDGFTEAQGDCNDQDATINPGAEDVPYDGIDQDCSGGDVTDQDQDGYDGGASGADCDDLDHNVHPGAIEVCDGLDNDCDGGIDDVDADGDGEIAEACGGADCDDADPDVHTGATEVEDGIDNDCDGTIDPGEETPTPGPGGTPEETPEGTPGTESPTPGPGGTPEETPGGTPEATPGVETPTPGPDETPEETPGAETPGPGGTPETTPGVETPTPGPGETPEETPGAQTPGPGETPGAETPGPGGTPEETPGDGGEPELSPTPEGTPADDEGGSGCSCDQKEGSSQGSTGLLGVFLVGTALRMRRRRG